MCLGGAFLLRHCSAHFMEKGQFQDSLVWCGWEINFSRDTIQLVSAKLTKLDALIKALLGTDGYPAKHSSSA